MATSEDDVVSYAKATNEFWHELICSYREEPCPRKIKSKDYMNRDRKKEAYERLFLKFKEAFPDGSIEQLKKKSTTCVVTSA